MLGWSWVRYWSLHFLVPPWQVHPAANTQLLVCLLRSLWPLNPCVAILGPTSSRTTVSIAARPTFTIGVVDFEATGGSGVSAASVPPRNTAMPAALAGAIGQQVGHVGDVVEREL